MNNKQPTEHAEQVAFVARCRREGIFVFSIPNGVNLSDSKLRFAEIEKLKAEGLVKGIPDLFIPQYKLFIEMKRRDGGVVSESQKKVHKILIQLGYKVNICYGAKEAWDTVNVERNKYNPLFIFNIIYIYITCLLNLIVDIKNNKE